MDSNTAAIVREEAGRLAVGGARERALELLGSLSNHESDAVTAMLRARILSQQGEFAKAAGCWRQALEQDPQSAAARRGLALAEALGRSPVGRLRLHARSLVLSVAVVASIAGVAWTVSQRPEGPTNRELADSLSRAEQQRALEARAASGRLEQQMLDLRRALEANANELQKLHAEHTRAATQSRDQLRRIERRTTELGETLSRLYKP